MVSGMGGTIDALHVSLYDAHFILLLISGSRKCDRVLQTLWNKPHE